MTRDIVFVKWGGAVITDKKGVKKARLDVIRVLGSELKSVLSDYGILLGHGSGSFGHWAAKAYEHLRDQNPKIYAAKVHVVAAELNQIVINELAALDIPAFHFPPSAIIFSRDDHPSRLCVGSLSESIRAGYLPVTYGDAVPDAKRGGTIYSTERVFFEMNKVLRPKRIVLVTSVDGVYTADPFTSEDAERITEITPDNYEDVKNYLGGAAGVDVTGGMLSKVETMLALVRTSPWIESVVITSAEEGNMVRAIRGKRVGTVIHT